MAMDSTENHSHRILLLSKSLVILTFLVQVQQNQIGESND